MEAVPACSRFQTLQAFHSTLASVMSELGSGLSAEDDGMTGLLGTEAKVLESTRGDGGASIDGFRTRGNRKSREN